MPKETKSAGSSKPLKPKRSPLARRLMAGLEEAAAHARGELQLPEREVKVPDHVDVADIRHRLGLSQSAYARTFGLDVTALHAWEQGRRQPDRAARILLTIIAKEPDAVQRALGAP